ncbi:MAG TPA: hypothetical protein PLA87_04985 [Pseudomonadota bacterium]|nr:hypothetical protein [Pseudomonadota bacterium]
MLVFANEIAVLPAQAAGPGGVRYFIKVGEVELSPAAAKPQPSLSEPAVVVPVEGDAALPPPAPPPPTAAAPPPAATAPPAAVTLLTRDEEKALAKEMLIAALRKRPEVTLELATPLTDISGVTAEVKRKGLKAYEVGLRVLRLERTVRPPTGGKKFRLLEQDAKLSLVGTTFPEKLLALGGDGESTVQIEVGNQINQRQEREVLEEALKDAIEQAVKQGMAKLSAPPGKAPKGPPRKNPAKK